MLDLVDNQIIDGYQLRVVLVGRARYFDQRDFTLYLIDARGGVPDALVFRGHFNAGRPSVFVPGWIDGEFIENPPEYNGRMMDNSILEKIAVKLGKLIPAGGRFWIAYEAFDAEGALMLETRAAMRERVPLLATPIGYLLFCAGCWSGLRDWDIPEGGREGPRKLQGNRPLNAEHARRRATEIAPALTIRQRCRDSPRATGCIAGAENFTCLDSYR